MRQFRFEFVVKLLHYSNALKVIVFAKKEATVDG